jgi:3-phytase
MMLRAVACLAAILALAIAQTVIHELEPAASTPKNLNETDDPAIWLHPSKPELSLIVGTVKAEKPRGALAVYDLRGKEIERHEGFDVPNNVDILGDIGIVTEPFRHSVRTFRMSGPVPHLRLEKTVEVFRGQLGEMRAPMGVALYRRKRDGALYAILSRADGPKEKFLWQYRIDSGGMVKVREFGAFSGVGDLEAVAVDQERELVFYSDEQCCVRVYRADPEAAGAGDEITRFAREGFKGDREGIAITDRYVIVTDQMSPRSQYHVFDKNSYREIAIWRGQSLQTDGIAATGRSLGLLFPNGLFVAMNERDRNFHFYRLP